MSQRRNAAAYETPVHFQLAFTHAKSAADPTARLVACQMRPHPAQARIEVLELSKLDLQSAFMGVGVLTEDVKDESSPINDFCVSPHNMLEVRLLRGAELIVEYHDVCLEICHIANKLTGFTRANERTWDRCIKALCDAHHDIRPVCLGKTRELIEGLLNRPLLTAQIHPNQYGSFWYERC